MYGGLEGPRVLQGFEEEMSSPGACQKVSRMNTLQTSVLLDSIMTRIMNTKKFQLHMSSLDGFQSWSNEIKIRGTSPNNVKLHYIVKRTNT